MALTDLDQQRLRRALALAQGAIGLSDPNPRVGCVLADAQGRVVGEGFTQQAGGPHAEVMALRAALAGGAKLAGGTAWVSLEPCAHHGRTPPCADALVDAGLARVVVAAVDPFPEVSGKGLGRLRAAGLQADVAPPGDIASAARALNIGFFSRVRRGRPWVRLKVAASLDGRTALPDGRSQWITGAPARADGHAWRKRAGAVLTGIGTVLADNPRMDVRLVDTARQPRRMVLDSRLAIDLSARILAAPGQVTMFCAMADSPKAEALRAQGAEVVALPGQDGRVDLQAVLSRLAADGVNELHVEAGARLNGAWLAAGLVDEVLAYIAPKLVGPGLGMVDWPTLSGLEQATECRFVECQPLGADLRLRALTASGTAFTDG